MWEWEFDHPSCTVRKMCGTLPSTRSVNEENSMKIKLIHLLLQAALTLTVYALPLFLPLGLRAWPAAWVFLGLWFGFWGGVLLWLGVTNPALLNERMRLSAPDQQPGDRLMGAALYSAIFLWLAFCAFDAARFHWSAAPLWLQGIGLALLLTALGVYFATFRANSYLSPVVRIQSERGQGVISHGPYAAVRHPMYAATLIFAVSTPLLLGSIFGVAAGAVVWVILGRRAVLEEKALAQDLPGYAEYMQRVRYRFIPFVW